MISIMTYSNWRQQFTPTVGGWPDLQAQLWNLEHEKRIGRPRGAFKRRIGQLYKQHQAAGMAPAAPAMSALNDAIGETRPPESKWLGKLEFSPGASIPGVVTTHLSSTRVAKYALGPFDPRHPVSTVKLSPIHTQNKGQGPKPLCRFIWITWAPSGGALPTTPTDLKRELGLTHFRKGSYVYRCRLAVDRARHKVYVPTCLDASLSPAWKPPPSGFGEPWGVTRDLTTGDSKWPELLVQVGDFLAVQATAELVGSGRTAIGDVAVDFMVGR